MGIELYRSYSYLQKMSLHIKEGSFLYVLEDR